MQTRTGHILTGDVSVAVTTEAPSTRRVSVLIPCLDEAETIAECVTSARDVLRENGLEGEVIVVDNGSSDGSGELARDAGLTYDFREIPRFVEELDGGAQLVVGNRFGGVQPGAMSWVSRVGNPLLSGFLNVLHRTNVRDVHCGMRALRRDVLPVLNLRTVGMEFASEMVIRATREELDVREVPIELHPRVGTSKLSPFRDGWRHLRVIVVYNPNFLFLLPGVVMFSLGAL